GCVSLATAQVLWTRSGAESLDKLRGEYGEHGLDRIIPSVKVSDDIGWLEKLRARVVRKKGKHCGLFGLWGEKFRNDPGVGVYQQRFDNVSSQSGVYVLLAGESGIPDDLEAIDLLSIMKNNSALPVVLEGVGIKPDIVRARLERTTFYESNQARRHEFKLTIHPGAPALLQEVYEQIQFDAKQIEQLRITEMPSGCIVTWSGERDDALAGRFPMGISETDDLYFIRGSMPDLNEFGSYLVGLYILGMLARYYPDVWVEHVNANTLLAHLSSEFCDAALNRVPLLTLSILDDCAYYFG
ncbi:MAG: hypothetical protein AB7O04_13230, partial [Hyphomonadaceae bacterium]